MNFLQKTKKEIQPFNFLEKIPEICVFKQKTRLDQIWNQDLEVSLGKTGATKLIYRFSKKKRLTDAFFDRITGVGYSLTA